MLNASENDATEDELAAKCWSDVQMETGFGTYQYYLDEYCDGEQALTQFMKDFTVKGHTTNRCVIFDIGESGSLTATFDMTLECLSKNPQKILLHLRNPPSKVLLRVLLLEPQEFTPLPLRLIDVIGLGLRITPDFFKSYLARNIVPREFSGEGKYRSSYGVLGRSAIMVVRKYLPGNPSCPPVLLILGHPAPADSRYPRHPGGLPSRQNVPLPFAQPISVIPRDLIKYPWPWIFERLFCDKIQSYQGISVDYNTALVYALLPVLEMCLERTRAAYEEATGRYRKRLGVVSEETRVNDIWKNAKEDPQNEMEEVRYRLRRWARYHRQNMHNFTKYLRTQGIRNLVSFEAFDVVREESEEILEESHALEADIRDWLQVRVGSLALEESRKSIQLSNLQIAESQRGKLLSCYISIFTLITIAE